MWCCCSFLFTQNCKTDRASNLLGFVTPQWSQLGFSLISGQQRNLLVTLWPFNLHTENQQQTAIHLKLYSIKWKAKSLRSDFVVNYPDTSQPTGPLPLHLHFEIFFYATEYATINRYGVWTNLASYMHTFSSKSLCSTLRCKNKEMAKTLLSPPLLVGKIHPSRGRSKNCIMIP